MVQTSERSLSDHQFTPVMTSKKLASAH